MKRFTHFLALLLTVATALLSLPACQNEGGGNKGDGKLFDIRITNITATGALIRISPTDKKMLYFYNIFEKQSFLDLYDSIEEAVTEEVIEYYRPYVESDKYPDFTWEYVCEQGTIEDNLQGNTMLMGETTYIVFAAGITSAGELIKVETEEFTTLPVEKKNLTFEITEAGGVVTVTPSNDTDAYFTWYELARDLDGTRDEDLIWYCEDKYGGNLAANLVHGVSTWPWYENWFPGDEYTVFAFGYDGGATTGVTRQNFRFTGVDRRIFSTIDEDKNFTTAKKVQIVAYGERLYNLGINSFEMLMDDDAPGQSFKAEFFGGSDPLDPTGTFTIKAFDKDDLDLDRETAQEFVYTAIQGKTKYQGSYTFGTFWLWIENDRITQYAAADSGTVKLAELPVPEGTKLDKNEKYVGIEVDILDPRGNHITCSYEGVAEFTDMIVFE